MLLQENRSFDSAQGSEALAGGEPEPWDEIVRTNFVLIGPLFSLRPIFERMGLGRCNFWGMNATRINIPHPQSNFFV